MPQAQRKPTSIGLLEDRDGVVEADRIIGSRIRELRLSRQLELKQVADLLGVSQRALRNIESGKKQASAVEITKLGSILDVPPSKFFVMAEATDGERGETLRKFSSPEYAEKLIAGFRAAVRRELSEHDAQNLTQQQRNREQV